MHVCATVISAMRNKVCIILFISVKLKLLGSTLTSVVLTLIFFSSAFYWFVSLIHCVRKTFAWNVNL